MKKFLAAVALLAILSGDLFADAKKKKQRKCDTIHKQVKKLRQSKLWRSCLIETCSLAGCGKCKPKKPPQACAEKAVDVIFVLDGSSSVGPKNFTVAQNFINGIVDKFNVSPEGVKIGLLQYSTSPRIEFNLNDHKTKKAVKAAVKNIDWILGDTHTALALRETHNSMVAPAYSAQKNRSRFVIVITDGYPQDFKQVPAAVNQLTSKGVKIFAIGVGKATRSELNKLAFTGEHSNTKDVFYADNYADAKRFTDTLVSLICKNVGK